ncbi:MAG: hypothetical protein MHPSP_004651 [Paramarteilia canceri]
MKCLTNISSFEKQQCYLPEINLFVVDIIYKRTSLLETEIDPEEDNETPDEEPIQEIYCSPVNNVKTRWNSMYSILEWAIDLLTLLKQAALVKPKMELITKFLTSGVKAKIDHLLQVLKPVKEVVHLLSAEGNNLLSVDIILKKCYNQITGVSQEATGHFFDKIKARRKVCQTF